MIERNLQHFCFSIICDCLCFQISFLMLLFHLKSLGHLSCLSPWNLPHCPHIIYLFDPFLFLIGSCLLFFTSSLLLSRSVICGYALHGVQVMRFMDLRVLASHPISTSLSKRRPALWFWILETQCCARFLWVLATWAKVFTLHCKCFAYWAIPALYMLSSFPLSLL